jgi:hypothetical protein
MPVAVVQEWTVGDDRSTTNYDAVDERIAADGLPDGLIVHSAGFVGDRFRVFDVWETQAHYERFMAERLMPAVAEIAPEGAPPEDVVSYELHNVVTK